MKAQLPAQSAWTSAFEHDHPPSAGWYAVLYGWDTNEGVFTDASYWNGSAWDSDFPLLGFNGPHPDAPAAKKWADEHNPEAAV